MDEYNFQAFVDEQMQSELDRLRAKLAALDEAGTGYSQQTVDAITKEREALRADNERLREALRFYAHGQHVVEFDDWETEEGWLCPPDESGMMVEYGGCAELALAGEQPDWEGDPPPIHPCEARATQEPTA